MTRSLLCLLLALTFAACGGDAPETPAADAAPAEEIPFVREGTLALLRGDEVVQTIGIEIAETDSTRARGMMGRTTFPDDSGMLFIFDREEVQSFWMANTPLALDLLFIDADSEIVDIHRYARPFSPDNITSSAPARFVLEVPAGFADTYGITETDRVRWTREGV